MTPEEHFEAALPTTQEEADELIALGMVLKVGMVRLRITERFLAPANETTYRTHFPAPGDGDWEITLKRRAP